MASVDASHTGVRRLGDVLDGRLRAVAAVVFALLSASALIAHDWLLLVESPISEAIRGQSLTDQFGIVTFIGGTEVAIVVATAVAAAVWRRCRTFALAYPGTLVVGAVLNIGLKSLIGRPRPPSPDTGVALASFPSGHTLQATLLLGILPLAIYLLTGNRRAFRAAVVASTIGIFGVGVSRVYLGAHWPTDVLGGVLVGAGLILALERIIDHPRSHRGCDCVLSLR